MLGQSEKVRFDKPGECSTTGKAQFRAAPMQIIFENAAKNSYFVWLEILPRWH
jgi:hypothetical protein